MQRSLICAHCGTVVGLETRPDPVRTLLFAHLEAIHHELVAFDEPRWAALLEHYFVVPSAPARPFDGDSR